MKRNDVGQATVEFVLVSIMLAFLLVLGWQMTWVAIQKWYFNFTVAYAARAWSVQPPLENTPQDILFKVQTSAWFRSSAVRKMPIVQIIQAEQENSSAGRSDPDDRFGTGTFPEGIRYRGIGWYFGYFQPETIERAGFKTGFTNTGAIIFETYIPIDHEDMFGVQTPSRYDNDCSHPCTDNFR